MDEMKIVYYVSGLFEDHQFFEQVFEAVNNNNPNEREEKLEALRAIRKAIRETRLFIKESRYTPSGKLSKLWYAAFEAALKIQSLKEDRFVQMLYDKSRYWEDPKSWSMNPAGMALVPRLLTVEDKCEDLMKEITK